MRNRFLAGGVPVSTLSTKEVLAYLLERLKNRQGGYVCFCNIRTLYIALKINPDYKKTLQGSILIIPDGQPLTWIGKFRGAKKIKRISGPEFMKKTLHNSPPNTLKHFFIGDTPETLLNLKQQFSKADVVGFFSPPFLSAEDFNYEEIALKIKASGANIVWVGLGSPKQDFFSKKISEKLPRILFMNVGAAFRYLLGEYKMPNKYLQQAGLTGVYWRFLKRPKEFIKFYPEYILLILKLIFSNEQQKNS